MSSSESYQTSAKSANTKMNGDSVKSIKSRYVNTVAVISGGVLLAGCATSAEPADTVTVTAPAETVTAPASPAVTETPAPATTQAAPQSGQDGVVAVPDFTQSPNYQDAQDLARGLGLLVMPAVDATGANRIPVLDSGWIVVGQDLPAGSEVPPDTEITMTVKKMTDN